MSKLEQTWRKWLRWGVIALLLYMPVHAFISIMLGHFLGYRVFWSLLKDGYVLVLIAALIVYSWRSGQLKALLLRPANLVIMFVLVVSIFVSLITQPQLNQLAFGIKANLLPLLLLLGIQPAYGVIKKYEWGKLVCLPAVVIAAVALIQSIWLPPQWLEWLGYNSNTIAPLQMIENSSNIHRAFASLGGPNQLGAYLIIPICFATVLALRYRRWRYLAISVVLLGGLIVSFSRSAWIGAALAIVAVLISLLPVWLRVVLPLGIVGALAMSWNSLATRIQNSSNKYLQFVLLHGRFFASTNMGSPDTLRGINLTTQLKLVLHEPWGHGLGSAGPASQLGSNSVVAENWYVQLAYEIGLVGLIGYVAAAVCFAIALWRDHSSVLRDSALVILLGLTVVNLFLHSMADSTLSYMAAIIIGLAAGEAYAHSNRT